MTSRTFLNGRVTLYPGDCRTVLQELPEASVDSVVCDPPYGLEFMGREWDRLAAKPRGRTAKMQVDTPTLEHKDDTPQHRSAVRQPAYLLRCKACGGNSSGAWGRCKCEKPDFRSRSDLGGGMQEWHYAWAVQVFRVLKPGGHLIAFSGTRTYHRMVCAIEDAGFEIRDQIGWAYGSGFPKSHDAAQSIEKLLTTGRARRPDRDLGGLSRHRFSGDREGGLIANTGGKIDLTTPEAMAVEGFGTALKPAWEPIVLARKPLIGTVAENCLRFGTGALNIDGCRVEGGKDVPASPRRAAQGAAYGDLSKDPGTGGGWDATLGRWPANVVHDGSEEVLAAFPESGGQLVDISPDAPSPKTGNIYGKMRREGEATANKRYTENGATSFAAMPGMRRADGGSAARFFACFPMENDECVGLASSREHANGAASSINLQSEAAAFALSNAVAMSAVGLTLNSASYRAPSMTVTGSEFELISGSVIELIQSSARRCSLGLPPERLSLTCSLADIAAVRKPTGTTAITISLLRSNGSAEPVTFDITVMNSELGASASPPKRLHYTSKAGGDDRLGSKHPTVKPLDLMQWLVRLVTPRGGTCLDPFAGTGTTGEAAWREGMRAILIEREEEYLADIERRMELAANPTKRAAVAKTKNNLDDPNDLPLFRREVAE